MHLHPNSDNGVAYDPVLVALTASLPIRATKSNPNPYAIMGFEAQQRKEKVKDFGQMWRRMVQAKRDHNQVSFAEIGVEIEAFLWGNYYLFPEQGLLRIYNPENVLFAALTVGKQLAQAPRVKQPLAEKKNRTVVRGTTATHFRNRRK